MQYLPKCPAKGHARTLMEAQTTQKVLLDVHGSPSNSLKPCSRLSSHALMALYFL